MAVRGGRARALAVGTAGWVLLVAGCASDDQDAAAVTPYDVASGVVLDAPDGAPVAGAEVELVVWPAAQSSGASPTASSSSQEPGSGEHQLVTLDTDVTDASGEFDLEALTAELTPHANADGLVGIELRVVGSPSGTRTSVRLDRAGDTGVASVVGTEDVVVVLPAGARNS